MLHGSSWACIGVHGLAWLHKIRPSSHNATLFALQPGPGGFDTWRPSVWVHCLLQEQPASDFRCASSFHAHVFQNLPSHPSMPFSACISMCCLMYGFTIPLLELAACVWIVFKGQLHGCKDIQESHAWAAQKPQQSASQLPLFQPFTLPFLSLSFNCTPRNFGITQSFAFITAVEATQCTDCIVNANITDPWACYNCMTTGPARGECFDCLKVTHLPESRRCAGGFM